MRAQVVPPRPDQYGMSRRLQASGQSQHARHMEHRRRLDRYAAVVEVYRARCLGIVHARQRWRWRCGCCVMNYQDDDRVGAIWNAEISAQTSMVMMRGLP